MSTLRWLKPPTRLTTLTGNPTTTEVGANDERGSGAVDGPARTCVGCRSVRPQGQLLRLCLDGDGRILIDRNGPGRGAWLCGDRAAACFALAVERKAFARAFRRAPDAASISALADHRLLSAESGQTDEPPDQAQKKP